MRTAMKHTLLTMIAIFITALMASCGMMGERTEADPESHGSAGVGLDEAIAATQVATDAFKDYAFVKRADFVSDRQAEMRAMETELNHLTAQAGRAHKGVKDEIDAKIGTVREKWIEAKQRLDKVESATESNWDDVQISFNKSYSELQSAFDETRRWLSQEIDPGAEKKKDTTRSWP